MLNKVELAFKLWQHFGLRWVLFRVMYAIRMRTRLLARRMPQYRWEDRPLAYWLRDDVPAQSDEYYQWRQEHGGKFFFDDTFQLPHKPEWLPEKTIAEANAILEGRWRYFSHTIYTVGFPPNWHYNPMTGQTLPADRHWSQISDLANGDIKLVWEANRFSVVYTLVRAYKLSGDERYAEGFWALIEDWASHNPPNSGPNWKCGQEASLRVMAWCFGLYGFAGSPYSTPERNATMAAMLAAHAERIERNISYARSQKNNHAVSEGMGLWTIGLLFPEFSRSVHWKRFGKQVLEEEAERQIYPDGAYVQHSMNYHRVMLHDYIWALRLGEINGESLSTEALAHVHNAVEFLFQFLDVDSGGVPNYGSNDGALLLPLNNCDYTDYRPIIQAGMMLLEKKRILTGGPWDEDLVWLFGVDVLEAAFESRVPEDFAAETGGYYTLRGENSWGMIRCVDFIDRPSQADQMHFDLWWKGINIACDAGTHMYNAQPPWNNGLASTGVHNTALLEQYDQMSRHGPFLWLGWPKDVQTAEIRSEHGLLACWIGESRHFHHAIPDGVVHRRNIVQLPADAWLVIDSLPNINSTHPVRTHWLLQDFPYYASHQNDRSLHLTLETPRGEYTVQVGCSNADTTTMISRATEDGVAGWQSLYYAYKQPALSLDVVIAQTRSPYFWWTIFSPISITVALDLAGNTLIVNHVAWQANIGIGSAKQIKIVELSGAVTDSLELPQ